MNVYGNKYQKSKTKNISLGKRRDNMTHTLRFRDDGSFKIVQFTDLHIGEDAKNEHDVKTLAGMDRVIQDEQPDLIAVTGDLIWSSETNTANNYRIVLNHLEKYNIPYAIVYGNHDSEENISRSALFELQQDYPGSLATRGPKDIAGVGNYALTIQSQKNDTDQAILYFLDSGDYAPKEIGGYAWIRSNQVNWFRSETEKYIQQHGKKLPALAFFHIPLPEYKDVLNAGAVVGHKLEGVCSPVINSGLFTAMREVGNIMGTFVGHDHDNDYCGLLHGISLCYGRATGYNVYGNLPHGARVINLQAGAYRFESWIRQDDGQKVAHYTHEHAIETVDGEM